MTALRDTALQELSVASSVALTSVSIVSEAMLYSQTADTSIESATLFQTANILAMTWISTTETRKRLPHNRSLFMRGACGNCDCERVKTLTVHKESFDSRCHGEDKARKKAWSTGQLCGKG